MLSTPIGLTPKYVKCITAEKIETGFIAIVCHSVSSTRCANVRYMLSPFRLSSVCL